MSAFILISIGKIFLNVKLNQRIMNYRKFFSKIEFRIFLLIIYNDKWPLIRELQNIINLEILKSI
jgi:hypothetical protein